MEDLKLETAWSLWILRGEWKLRLHSEVLHIGNQAGEKVDEQTESEENDELEEDERLSPALPSAKTKNQA